MLPPALVGRYRAMHAACSVPGFEQETLRKFIAGGYLERHVARMRVIYKSRLLALERAQKFRSLLDSRYGLSPMYTVRVEADVEKWQACDAAIRSSSLGDKQQVLDILDSSVSESAKEQQLKRLPSAWNVLRSQILPSMRRVDMKIFYDVDAVVEVRTLIEKPRPKPTTVAQRPNRPPFKDDMSLGVIVDMNHEDGLY